MRTKRLTLTLGLILGCSLAGTQLVAGGMDNSAALENSRHIKKPKKRYIGWYMRTVATATLPDGRSYTHATAGVFGKLRDSRFKEDKHDIPSMGSGVVQVLFTPRWAKDGHTYFSDYRGLKLTKYLRRHKRLRHDNNVWIFEVRNPKGVDLSDADLNLKVEGPFDAYKSSDGLIETPSKRKRLLRQLKLVDLDHKRVYPYKRLRHLHLSMDGQHVRHFRWVIGRVLPRDKKLPKTATQKQLFFAPAPSEAKETFGTPPSL